MFLNWSWQQRTKSNRATRGTDRVRSATRLRLEQLEERCLLNGTPLPNDADTLLLLPFDGELNYLELTGASGEQPLLGPDGVYPGDGIIGGGVYVTDIGSLRYASVDNILSTQGTVEFWFNPNWNYDDNTTHTFFEAGDDFNNGMVLRKDGGNNALRFIQWGDDPLTATVETNVEVGIVNGIDQWQQGEWHHVAATWDGAAREMALYIDGRQVGNRADAVFISEFSCTGNCTYFGENNFTIGWEQDDSNTAEGTFDEFRITDRARNAAEIMDDYDLGLGIREHFAVSAGQTGARPDDEGRAVVVDSEGNSYVAGTFFQADANADTLSTGSGDIFVAKYNSKGTRVWQHTIGSTGDDRARGIAIDSLGNIYVTGGFRGTVDFDPGISVRNLVSSGGFDAFVLKLNSAGHHQWSHKFGGSSATADMGYGATVDAAGGVLVTGHFGGTVDFNPASSTLNLTSAGQADVFVLKLTSAGGLVWAKRMGGTGIDRGLAITTDSARSVYTTGSFSGTADFDPGSTVSNLTSAGNTDVFVSGLTSSGVFLFAKRMGGSAADEAHDIELDPTGAIYTTGYFSGTADFNPGTAVNNLTSAGGTDIFLSKLAADAGHGFVFANRIGGYSDDRGRSLVIAQNGTTIAMTGHFTTTVDFDPSAEVANLTSAGSTDTFVARYLSDGGYLTSQRNGGSGLDAGRGIARDGRDDLYVTGFYKGTVAFDTGDGIETLTSVGGKDIFLTKIVPPPTAIIEEFAITLYPGVSHAFILGASSANRGYVVEVSPLQASVGGAHVEHVVQPEFYGAWYDVLRVQIPSYDPDLQVNIRVYETSKLPVITDATGTYFPGFLHGTFTGPSSLNRGHVVEVTPLQPSVYGAYVEHTIIHPEYFGAGAVWNENVRVRMSSDNPVMDVNVRVYETSKLPIVTDFTATLQPGVWHGWILGPSSQQRGHVAEISPLEPSTDGAHIERYVAQPEFDGSQWNDVLRVQIPSFNMALDVRIRVYEVA